MQIFTVQKYGYLYYKTNIYKQIKKLYSIGVKTAYDFTLLHSFFVPDSATFLLKLLMTLPCYPKSGC